MTLTFYLVFYGQFDMDLGTFTTAVGLSIALNGGVRSRAQIQEAPVETVEELVPAPA